MVEKFIEIFQGLRLGYGLTKRGNVSEQGKVESSHRWVEKELTKEIVQGHLDGTGDNLGIVPINEENKCKCNRHDEYTFNHKEFTQKMRDLKIPLLFADQQVVEHTIFVYKRLCRRKRHETNLIKSYSITWTCN